MHEIGLDEKLQCAIHGRRRSSFAIAAQSIQDLVCADRFVAIPYELQYAPPGCRQPQLALATDLIRRLQRLLHAVAVIMFGVLEMGFL